MNHVVIVPQNFQINAINRFTSFIISPEGKPISDEITLDFSKLNFIDGGGYTVLCNSIEWLLEQKSVVRFKKFDRPSNLAIQYLDDCGFFKTYVKSNLRRDARVRDTTLPCTFIKNSQAFDWIENRLSPWLGYILDRKHGELASIRTCVKEVINNISDHSTLTTGFVHAQHYPNVHNVKVTVSDFGAGIPETIRRRYGQLNDRDAILHAIKDGVTSKSRPNNMGAGLSYLVDTVAANAGVVRIHSLSGNVVSECDNRRKMRLRSYGGTGRYPGTLIEIELDTRLFIGDEDEEVTDFEW